MANDAGRRFDEGAAGFSIVAVAASAGGLRALERIFGDLPAGFPAAIMVVQHLDRNHPSILAQLLGRHTRMKVREARDGERVEPGVIYVAPPDRHLVAGLDGCLRLNREDLVHYLRPSADRLFESAALAFGSRMIAVVLTGTGLDGATGVSAVKRGGGTVIAQDEASSEYFAMPDAAIRTGDVDFVLPLDQIGPKLISLAASGAEPPT
jgi:two-component system, chemotaxis family, protein-glutamate methylesterase/glutaminase